MTDEQIVWLTVYAMSVGNKIPSGIAVHDANRGVENFRKRFNDTDPAPPPRPELPTMPEVG